MGENETISDKTSLQEENEKMEDLKEKTDENQSESYDYEEEYAKMVEKFVKAGNIAASVLKEVPKLVVPGESLLDIVESLEKMINDSKGKPAFPATVCINEIAAHYTPEIDNKDLIGEKDLVKIDLGAHIDGCIGDVAMTVDLSDQNGKLIEASEVALSSAIAMIKPGVKVGDIGGIIEKEIVSRGFLPIQNLSGHKIEPYLLHAGEEIPNIKSNASYTLNEGDIFAIEPFASTGSGRVADTSQVEVFAFRSSPKLRMKYSRELLAHITNNYMTLPFAERWLSKVFNSRLTLSTALRELLNTQAIYPYPVLRDTGKGLVSQKEHTVIIEHDSAKVITL